MPIRALSLPVVEAALNGFSEPQFVELSYSQTGWALHFVEARFGRAGIHEMLAAFRDGLDTEAALERALGLGTEAFDREFWEWARTAAPSVWATEAATTRRPSSWRCSRRPGRSRRHG